MVDRHLAPEQARGSLTAIQIDSHTDLVIAVDVAKRLGISPLRVNVLAMGFGFPKPLGKLGRSSVWRWSSIERWAPTPAGSLPFAQRNARPSPSSAVRA